MAEEADLGYSTKTYGSTAYHHSSLSSKKKPGSPARGFSIFLSNIYTGKTGGIRNKARGRYALEGWGPFDDKIGKNGAKDRFEEMIMKSSKYSVVESIMDRHNRGYAYGMNSALHNVASLFVNKESSKTNESNLKLVFSNQQFVSGAIENPAKMNLNVVAQYKKVA